MMLDLRPIKARLAAVTPGTWTLEPTVGIPNWSGTCLVLTNQEDGPRARLIGTISTNSDARLVAYAPTDLAALVAEVGRLRGELDDAEARIERLLGALEVHQYYVAEIERLRGAIEDHWEKLAAHSLHGLANAELWEVLDE